MKSCCGKFLAPACWRLQCRTATLGGRVRRCPAGKNVTSKHCRKTSRERNPEETEAGLPVCGLLSGQPKLSMVTYRPNR